MSRTHRRPIALTQHYLATCRTHCWTCDAPMWVAYTKRRQLMTLAGLVRLHLSIRRCRNPACPRYHRPYRPEAEGAYALPHGEFGLDVIALVGALRFAQHRSVAEIQAALNQRGIAICERSVTEQLYRYEELLALRLADHQRLRTRVKEQGFVVLALDALQPDVGHEVLWVLRDSASPARSCSPAASSGRPRPTLHPSLRKCARQSKSQSLA